jgi:hypothetical protein
MDAISKVDGGRNIETTQNKKNKLCFHSGVWNLKLIKKLDKAAKHFTSKENLNIAI